ncbi:hypothetical protein [Microbacterium karelineae]|uniref:hypothetical protein n=1 Tax=Microbacterium karelineae TaxID=2654283 RepID=UPI001E6419BF|nr:hypothetical protein [Microbacterium karelineae]
MSTAPRTPRIVVAICGAALIAAYSVTAGLQILLWNPLAAVPGRTLPQIRAAMEAAGEHLATVPVLIFLSIGPALAIAVLVLAATGLLPDAPTVAIMMLGILVAGAPTYFVASFGPGMALADAFLISGGDHAGWAGLLYAVSAAALVAMPLIGLVGYLRSRRAASRSA